MKDRGLFLLRKDYIDQFDNLKNEDAGRVIKAIFQHVNGLPEPTLTGVPAMAYSFIRNQVDEDAEKQEAKRRKNAENGKRGGRPKKTAQNLENEKPNGFENNHSVFSEAQEEQPAPKKPKHEYSGRFEEFWTIYPRKSDKGRAFKCWEAREKEGYSPEEMIEAAKNYKAELERNHTELKYTKMASTFLSVTGDFTEYIPKAGEQKRAEDGYGNIDFGSLV